MTSIAALLTARPRRVLLAAFAFVLVAAVIGGSVVGQLEDRGGFTPPDAESVRAAEQVAGATGLQSGAGIVLVVDDPAQAPALRSQLTELPGVARVDRGPVSQESGATFLAATLRADADEDAAVTAAEERFEDTPGLVLGGGAVADRQIGDRVSEDLGRAELFAFPILLVLSLLFFRGRAAVIPLLVGLATILATFLVLAAINQVHGLSIFALNLVIGLGLGLAIDYTLFLLTRFREELRRDRADVAEALRTTLSTAGRTVVYSAITVSLSLLTLVLFPLNFLQSMGIAGAVVSIAAAAAALVIGGAMFALWGRKLVVAPGRSGEGRWYQIAHGVMSRPGAIATVTALLMLAAAAPSLRAEWTPVDSTAIPKDLSARVVADRLDAEFPSDEPEPIVVVAAAPVADAPQVRALAGELRSLEGTATVPAPRALGDERWLISVTPRGAGVGIEASTLVERIRATSTPVPFLVGGTAAEFADQQAAIGDRLLPAAALLGILIFAVLWLMTGSLLLPIKAIIMNVLTVGASLGALTLVFQDGRFEGLLGYTPNGGVEPTDFVVAAALIFALSTDYGVFLLGRIKEARETIADEREAVAIGLERTGAVITAAAILLAVAIGSFMTSSIVFIQQIGLAAAAGVLLDAFVVRALLVPSLMALLGRWNWWSPRALARLHARLAPTEG